MTSFLLVASAVLAVEERPILKTYEGEPALTRVGFEILCRGKVLEVWFHKSGASEADFRRLARLKNVAFINLATADIADKHVLALRNLDSLVELHLPFTKITDKAMKAVKSNVNLRRLNVGRTAISDQGVACLSNLTSLEVLDLSGTKITSKALDSLQAMRYLLELGLADTQVDNEGLAKLSQLPSLSSLWLSGTRINNDGVAKLCKLPSLSSLWLNDTQVDDEGVAKLKGLPSLSSLWLDGPKITNKSILSLGANNTKLVELSLQACDLDDSCIGGLTQLKQLRKLLINSTEISIEGMRKLRALENLEELWLGSRTVDGERVLGELKRFKKLTKLWLMGIKLPLKEIHTQVAELRNLRHILFSSCNLDTKTVERIRIHNPDLRVEVID